MRRFLLVACLAAAMTIVGIAPAGAATTLRGRIVGQPQVSGAHARVPLVLAGGSEVVLTVPATSGFRTVTTGRTEADRTRLGDAVSARVRTVRRGAARAAYLKIVARSAAPPFADLRAQLGAAAAGTHLAADELARLGTAQVSQSPDPGTLRLALLSLRTKLNILIASLRSQAKSMDAVTPTVKGSAALTRQLGDASGGARSAATKLEDGVTELDEIINAVGGSSAGPLPVGTAGTVSEVLTSARQVLDALDPQQGLPGAPALPDPLGGVPLPPLPAALPG